MEQAGQRRARKIAALIVLCLALGLIQDRVRLLHMGAQSLQWPSVVGQVIEAESRQIAGTRTGSGWMVRVSYAYQVGDVEFVGTRQRFSRRIGGQTRVQADDELRQYVPGGAVLVHYDPRRPQRAVLKPGPDQRAYFGMVVGFGLLLIALLFWFVPTRSGRGKVSARR